MRISRVAAMGSMLLLTACGGPTGPGGARVARAPRLTGQQIAVSEFSLDGANVRYGGSSEAFGIALAEEIASSLRERGYQAQALPANAPPRGAIVVSGRITRVDGGSQALRYFVSFGAGATKFGAAGAVTGADGTRLAGFSDERWSGWGIFGGSSRSLLQKCVRQVGRDIADMVDTGEYRQ